MKWGFDFFILFFSRSKSSCELDEDFTYKFNRNSEQKDVRDLKEMRTLDEGRAYLGCWRREREKGLRRKERKNVK